MPLHCLALLQVLRCVRAWHLLCLFCGSDTRVVVDEAQASAFDQCGIRRGDIRVKWGEHGRS